MLNALKRVPYFANSLEAKNVVDAPPFNHCLMDDGRWIKDTRNMTDMLGAEAARYIAASSSRPWFV